VIYFFHNETLPVSYSPCTARKKGKSEQGRAECDGEACAGTHSGLFERSRSQMTKAKKRSGHTGGKKIHTVGERVIEGFEEAIAWSKGDDVPVRVTHVQVPDVDISKIRRQMGLSQTQFA